MKKLKITIALLTTIILFSCGNSMESDVQKYKDVMCKMDEFRNETNVQNMTTEESVKAASLGEEIRELENEFREKYSSKEDSKKLEELKLEVLMKGCN